MTEVVIRSASEQTELAGKLGGAIADAGFQVWRADGADDDFWHSGEVVERIRSAKAAVVIWSEGAAASALICDEANAARQQQKLIQVSADGRSPPAPFDGAPVAQLSGWRGEPGHPGWRQVIQQLEEMSASGGGAKAKRQIARALRSITFPSLPRRLRTDPIMALPSPYGPVGSRNSRRFEPVTALLLVALTSAAGAAGWVGGRQQGIREGAATAAAAADVGRLSLASAGTVPGGAPRRSFSPAPAVRTAAAASATLTAPASAPAPFPAEVAAPAAAEATRPTRAKTDVAAKASGKTAREQKPAAKNKAPVRSKPTPAAKPKPARPRIKYRYSENMRLFCRGAGKATPECRIFRQNAPRRRR
ncbi:MAG: toll/interleukin-1 receptor domain-containing protein [Pseudomonadota bacterium]|nr:toll/interleukin-1 receptor domain-containing protein [Pseudomonadota bacterium]